MNVPDPSLDLDPDDAPEPLLSLATRIAEGAPVDPSTELGATVEALDAGDRAVLSALLDIATIEAAHRQAEESFDQLGHGPSPAPRQWGPLTILEAIGHGEFGDIYRAHHHKLERDVALKLSPVGADSDAERLLQEARLLARVHHPNVVRIYDVDHRQGRVGFWMDMIQGRTLEEICQAQGFSPNEAIDIGITLCRALAAVHQVGVLHGDIKAHNVMRQDATGQILLVDFGAGRPLHDLPAAGNDTIGTPVYLAPEVLAGQPRSTASDIYSLGVLLFHLVTGQYPVYASTRFGFIDAHRAGARKHLRDLRPDADSAFVQVIERATASDPVQRYNSAGALEAALVHLRHDTAPAAATGPTQASTREEDADDRRGMRRRWLPLGGALAALALMAIAVLLLNGRFTTAEPGTAGLATGDAPAGGASAIAAAGSPNRPDVGLPTESYVVDAAFYRNGRTAAASDEPLDATSSVVVGDLIHARVRTSKPTYFYVVNEDDRGHAFLLFPLKNVKEERVSNPLPADRELRIPGSFDWKIDRAGGRDHFIVFASTQPIPDMERAFDQLAIPGQRLDAGLAEQVFRGAGGLAKRADGPTGTTGTSSNFSRLFTTPLTGRESARGLWVRQLTVASLPR